MSYSKNKFLHDEHYESHKAHIRNCSSQTSDTVVLFCLTTIVLFLLVAPLFTQNIIQSAHVYTRFEIAAGSDKILVK
jgi:hypothetical protein